MQLIHIFSRIWKGILKEGISEVKEEFFGQGILEEVRKTMV